MFLISDKNKLAQGVYSIWVEAPKIAQHAKAGQFVIVIAQEDGERVPLTIVDKKGDKIRLIFQVVGKSTQKMAAFEDGDSFAHVVGPLGTPSEIDYYGTVLLVGGGIGVAPVFPILKALKEKGNRVISIIGARTSDLVILEEEFSQYSDKVLITTDDGSKGIKGLVTDGMRKVVSEGEKIDKAWAIGPVIMMKYATLTAQELGFPIIVSLNPIMVDGTGMCGGCRVTVGNNVKFACVDGPEFEGELVEWDELLKRLGQYKIEEKTAIQDQPKKQPKKILKNKVPIKKQPPEVRKHNFQEVAYGYCLEEAMMEAERCLQCPDSAYNCIKGCPVGIDIRGFIREIKEGNLAKSAEILKSYNNLPAICGRVCPQENQCEGACTLGKSGIFEPVAIGRLERFVADWERVQRKTEEKKEVIKINEFRGKVAVVGAGPAGLTVAADLAKIGYYVKIFEALHKPGGVLTYGIPEFRLPKQIVFEEVEYVKSLGVEIETDVVVGKTITIDELRENFDAIFIGTGAGTPKFLNISGENLNGVYSSSEFLTRVNLMKAYQFPLVDTPVKKGKNVVVVGGGNVAMDASRSALRLGAESVTVVYRRTEEEMPARKEEYENAVEEGINFMWLTNPIECKGDETGNLISIICQKMKLGEPDSSGRRRPVPVENSEIEIPADLFIVAIGQESNKVLLNAFPELKLNKWGYIEADPITGATSIEGIYAGGDIVTGAATVIEAMGAGKRSAKAIDEYISSKVGKI
ncbi:bifunctional dihydroorotate dehydrogenase B NAD binding subunit/NADPH-dependent glutamate synthase [Petrotoga sp. 9PWA.NaAc.5.4]|uniref:bifunctional dihydroorotate dehydrogenase B NAD binding subunit/NADPH-dependent glutamate synthase n=1 Tax=Petrotoga sp. 9PWA.NaAc.5.4 TaxID=1434328 RepID=UPI000CC49B47|nr:bifunctional dihydroorotate dehydrogenase B NAD binding subunit/NADPH-dependent glutamate synthase [Petrotoga sp. 9PWA.NaAc.5.4]PNR92409.1 2-polyprenylphenol hydroxylase [Petrotoga sp. 9PWA.NaAc.5.4]